MYKTKCGEVTGPIGIYWGGDGQVYVSIEGFEVLEEMIRQRFGPNIEIVFESPAPKKSLDARLALVEEQLAQIKEQLGVR